MKEKHHRMYNANWNVFIFIFIILTLQMFQFQLAHSAEKSHFNRQICKWGIRKFHAGLFFLVYSTVKGNISLPFCILAGTCFCDFKNVLHRKILRIFFFWSFSLVCLCKWQCVQEICVYDEPNVTWFESKKNVLIENKVQWLCIRPHKIRNVCLVFSTMA